MIESATKEIVKCLADYIKQLMPELEDVLCDWPEPNVVLKYPAMTVFTGAPTHRPFAPYIISNTAKGSDKFVSKYVVGDYEWKIQLDMWCSHKPQRHALYERFYQAFNNQFVTEEHETAGISLPLVGYHNTIARYDLVSYNFDDSEAGSQRKEWRTKFGILAHCKAILEREHYKIVETELQDDIRADIVIPE